MAIKSDHWIRRMVGEHTMIEPFAEAQVRDGVVSYGVSSYGYDVRVGRDFKIFTNVYGDDRRSEELRPAAFVDIEGDVCVIPPNSFALAETVEYFEIPRDVLAICVGKSDLRPLRHHRQRDAAGARVARQDHHRNQQHHAAAGQDLRQRGHRPDPLLQGRRACARRATPTRRASTRTRTADAAADVGPLSTFEWCAKPSRWKATSSTRTSCAGR